MFLSDNIAYMNNRILLLVSLGAACAAGLAAMGALSRNSKQEQTLRGNARIEYQGHGKDPQGYIKQEEPTGEIAIFTESGGLVTGGEKEAAGMVCRTDERAALVGEVLSRMKNKSKREISPRILSDTGDFLVALDGAIAEDNGNAHGDLPLLFLIDKEHSVSRDYVPRGLVPLDGKGSYTVSRNGLSLRPEASSALEKMARAAKNDGVTLMASSTYRSYDYQKTVYEKWVKIDGQEEADRESARPGTSQHQLGCAVDFGSITDDFADTKMGKWVYAHAADWGWSLSFPRGYEDVTGYRWECWHFRYIGREACRLQDEWFCGVQQYMMEFIDIYKSLIREGKS